MYKKIIILLLSISLVLSLSVNTFADSMTFNDTDGSEWFYADLTALATKGIIAGTGSGNFEPNGLLTKDALIKTLVVASGTDPGNAASYWAQNYIDHANQSGWLTGMVPEQYTQSINRYESCKLIVNALGNTVTYPTNLSSYSLYIKDYDAMPAQYQEVVLKVYSLGIITGYSDGTFTGSNTLRRSEMTAIISRYINPSARKTPINPEKLSTIQSLASNEDSNVFDSNFLNYEAPFLLYKDDFTEKSIPINSSGLNPNIARLSEDLYLDIATNMEDIPGYRIHGSYSSGHFSIQLIKSNDNSVVDTGNLLVTDPISNSGTLLVSYTAPDKTNQIRISVDELKTFRSEKLDQHSTTMLNTIFKQIDSTNLTAIMSFVESQYQVNDTLDVISKDITIGGNNYKTVSDIWGFSVIVTLP